MTPGRGLRLDRRHPWRHENTGRLLLVSLGNWKDALVRGLQDKGFRGLRASHMNLLRHIDVGGTKITEIAERSGLSKQAVGQLLVDCVAAKLVKTVPHPSDRRAKVATFTSRGKAVIEAEREVMERIDGELEALLGAARYAELRRALTRFSEWSARG